MEVWEAIRNRACFRAFLDKPVSEDIVRQILDVARFAPSGVNTQPWQVAVLGSQHKKTLAEKIIAARKAGVEANPDYHYYPEQWIEPYKSRRFACGMALYGALDIKREDTAARQAVWDLNYHFFHAPLGLIFYMDKHLQTGSYMDCAMFIQNVMLAARHFGLETCPEASLADYPDLVRETLSLTDSPIILCGMALGYPDLKALINQYRTERLSVDEFTQWFD
jgi:nitroreductase